jgi:GntR family transcriptional regulator
MAKTPEYQRIVRHIRDQIDSGVLRPGDQLPTIRELMARYNASTAAVKTALLVLMSAGVTAGYQGRGVFVTDDVPQALRPQTSPTRHQAPTRSHRMFAGRRRRPARRRPPTQPN